MTRILVVESKQKRSLSCKAEGHASFAGKGKDIVCASVTILIRTFMQVLSEIDGLEFESDFSRRGMIQFHAVLKEAVTENVVQLECIGKLLVKGFRGLEQEFPQNISFDYKLED